MSAPRPKRCTGITAQIRFPSFVLSTVDVETQRFTRNSSSRAGDRAKESGSMSIKIGVAPTRAMQPAVEKKVNGVVNTASPGPIPNDIRIMSWASVPDEVPIPQVVPTKAAIFCSSSSTWVPRMKFCWSHNAAIPERISSRKGRYCLRKSKNGTLLTPLEFSTSLEYRAATDRCKPNLSAAERYDKFHIAHSKLRPRDR